MPVSVLNSAQGRGDQLSGWPHWRITILPDWILAPICVVGLVSFIWFAFRQGFKVKPDKNNRDDHPDLPLGPDGSWR